MDNTVGSRVSCNEILTKRQTAIIIGSLLGDGCLEKRENGVRLRLDHGFKQKDYLFWKHQELKNIAGKILRVNYYHKGHNKFYENYRFSTLTSKLLSIFWKKFYRNGNKIVPKNICKLLTEPIALAIWHMDDGYKRNDCNALRLNTDSFSRSEQDFLRNALEKNFGIKTKVHKKGGYWNIYIPEKESKKFVDLVKPYIHNTLNYKIALTP